MQNIAIKQILGYLSATTSSEFNYDGLISGVVIDSRQVQSDVLFVAIAGDNQDGHDYVKNIVLNNNCFALVNKNFTEKLPNLIYVDDPVLALGQLAARYRNGFTIPVVAITGSNGKTTVKEMLRNILQLKHGIEKVLVTEGNLNNHLGVPLTLCKLNTCHQVAVIEMGMNHSGEIDYLANLVKPTIAAINNVLLAHAGHFNGISGIAKAKGEIYHGLGDGVACVNVSSEFANLWLEQDITTQQVFSYGAADTRCYIKQITLQSAIYVTPLGEVEISLQILGQHNYFNALTVIVLAINLGCNLTEIKLGLDNYAGYKGRLEQKVAFNGAIIIDDTYNANPDSVKSALSAIQVFKQVKWFIFADLKELGSDEIEIHQKLVKEIAAANINKLITVGNLAKQTSDKFAGDKLHFENNEDVVEYCLESLPQDALLLVKASNSMRLFDIVNKIVKK
jgi:UDP-N-acetylmuramoyl-tripeptide--D-alanyl-D-alanine ligase